MLKMFRYLKRIISQFFKRSYWYGNRKITKLWFDEDTNKYENVSYPKNARSIMNSTWEGESDIWYTVLLKLDHMFWNLRKYGFEKDWYIYSSDINNFGTKEDKVFLTNKVIDEAFKKERKFKNIYLIDGCVSSDLSDDGRITIYLKYDDDLKTMYLTAKTNKLIPQEDIPKKKKLYSVKTNKDKDGKITFERELVDRYTQKQEYILDSEHNPDPKECVRILSLRLDSVIKDFTRLLNIDKLDLKSLEDMILDQIDIIGIDYTVKDRLKLSNQLKSCAVGNFIKCRDILHLRHLIKNLMRVSEDDTKYDYLWKNVKDNNDQKLLAIEESSRRYNEDRKEAYRKVSEFMCEKSLTWWD